MGNQAKIWKILLEHMMKIYEHIRNIETNLGKYGKRSPELVGKSWENHGNNRIFRQAMFFT
jgi:hypothetical protein